MNWYVPREHGAWAMLIVPYWIGAAVSGITLWHIIFFLAIFSFYFAQGPILSYIRNPKKNRDVGPSLTVYLSIGAVFLIPVLISEPTIMILGLPVVPLFLINLWFAYRKNERAFTNDVVAITCLSWLLVLAYYLGEETISSEALALFAWTIAFFVASVFHVKSLIREKKNRTFHRISFAYHILLVILPIVMQAYLLVIPFLASALKTTFIPVNRYGKPMHIGVAEIVNSLLYIGFAVMSFYMGYL
ncbi:YwiC-like family protein [Texcoconibacillus texcoconensis]|uniref:YwiC-like protein n=1 Tax=Texcoconibacillus texcoconensis TaxID=1095777 RepID=A0A840QU60_9BACI|nr:YwiC-like family protein [Texcoconibacillus texcoconensis]MBB5174821.1 hypothetical protein [Texcoconibacillus texcoconensis]